MIFDGLESNLDQNAPISKWYHQINQYCSIRDETTADRKLRFIAIDRRQSRLKRGSISPIRGHVKILGMWECDEIDT